ncbi:hypothetical protein JCM13664_16250 [Methylothermus subterraneus]
MKAWLVVLGLLWSVSAWGAETISPEVFRALKDAESQLDADPGSTLKRLESVRAKAKTDLEQALLAAYLSYAHLALGRSAEAAREAEEALASPKLPAELRPKLHAVLGQAQLQLSRFQEAARALETAGDEPQIRYLAAYAHYRLGQYTRAAQILEAILSLPNPPKEWGQLLLACYLEGQNFDRAADWLAKQLARRPNEADLWQQWLALKLRARRPQEALAAMVLAWHAGQLDAKQFLDLARLYAAAGIPEKGARLIEAWRDQGRLAPTVDTLRLEAELWLLARERRKALPVLEQVAKLRGQGSDFLAAARVAAELESWQETARLARQALQTGLSDPSEAELWLGIAAYHLGDPTAAETALTRLQHSRRLGPYARHWLGCVRAKRRTCR